MSGFPSRMAFDLSWDDARLLVSSLGSHPRFVDWERIIEIHDDLHQQMMDTAAGDPGGSLRKEREASRDR